MLNKLKKLGLISLILAFTSCSNINTINKEPVDQIKIIEDIKDISIKEPTIKESIILKIPEIEETTIEIKPEIKPEKPEVKPIIVIEPEPVVENEKKQIVIVGTADVHGRVRGYKYKADDRDDVGGFAKISTFVKEMREKYPDLLLIDLGDIYFYEPFVKSPSPSIVPILNYLEYDLITIGNHELYMKMDYLMSEVSKFAGPTIANNVYNKGNKLFTSQAILETDGIKVAFTGSSIPQVGIRKFLLSYEYDITDPLEETKASVEKLNENYDILVGTFHLNKFGQNGHTGSVEVMNGIEEFDFAFSGHEHVDEGNWTDDKGRHIIANNAYGITASYAIVDLEKINDNWEVTAITPEIVHLEDYKEDPEFIERFQYLHEDTIKYIDKGFSGWENIYHKLHEYIIP